MIDVHCHILYDLDDGSESIEESLEMARLACSAGTTGIIATPHTILEDDGDFWHTAVVDCVRHLNDELVKENINLKVYSGCEIFCVGDFLERLKANRLFTLNNSIYPLVEFDFYEHPASVMLKLGQIISEGFVPVVAHPERYAFVNEDADTIKKLKNMGCLIQLNKGSINGRFGAEAHFSAHEILKNGLADFVASDAHSPYMRTPVLTEAYETVCDMYSRDYADLLFNDNPEKILNNYKI